MNTECEPPGLFTLKARPFAHGVGSIINAEWAGKKLMLRRMPDLGMCAPDDYKRKYEKYPDCSVFRFHKPDNAPEGVYNIMILLGEADQANYTFAPVTLDSRFGLYINYDPTDWSVSRSTGPIARSAQGRSWISTIFRYDCSSSTIHLTEEGKAWDFMGMTDGLALKDRVVTERQDEEPELRPQAKLSKTRPQAKTKHRPRTKAEPRSHPRKRKGSSTRKFATA